jgi:hypothetical protein
VNRIVDIKSYIDHKVRTNVANTGKGPAGSRLRKELAKEGKKLLFPGDDDETANFQYVKHFLREDFRLMGQQFGLEFAEAFRYIGPPPNYRARLAKQGRRLPLLGSDDQTADREYVRHFPLDDYREYGKPYHLRWAERFTYVDGRAPARSKVDEYVERNSVRI